MDLVDCANHDKIRRDCNSKNTTGLLTRHVDTRVTSSPTLSDFAKILISQLPHGTPVPSLGDPVDANVENSNERVSDVNSKIQDRKSSHFCPMNAAKSKCQCYQSWSCSASGIKATFSTGTIWNPSVTLSRVIELSPFPQPATNLRSIRNLRLNALSGVRYRQSEEMWFRQRLGELKKRGSRVLEDPESLDALGSLGRICKDQGKHKEAEHLLRNVALARKGSLGFRNRETLSAYSAWTEALIAQGKEAEAAEIHRDVYATAIEVLDPKDTCRLETTSIMAMIHYDQGNDTEASDLGRQVLQIQLETVGPRDTTTLRVMSFLGNILRWDEKVSESEHLLRWVVETREQRDIADIDWCLAMRRLAATLSDQDQHSDSVSVLCQALERAQTTLGSNHDETLAIQGKLAGELRFLGKPEEGERLSREIYTRQLRNLGLANALTLASLRELGRCLHDMARYVDAAECFKTALEGWKMVLKTDTAEIFDTFEWLGECYDKMKLYPKAMGFYREAYRGFMRLKAEGGTVDDDINFLVEAMSKVEKTVEGVHIEWTDFVESSFLDTAPMVGAVEQ